MAIPVASILGARQEAERAKRTARPDAKLAPQPAQIYTGKVVAVEEGGGAYEVDVTDDAGNVIHTWRWVRPVPPTVVFAADALVWLVQHEGQPQPVILATSATSTVDFGILVD